MVISPKRQSRNLHKASSPQCAEDAGPNSPKIKTAHHSDSEMHFDGRQGFLGLSIVGVGALASEFQIPLSCNILLTE